MYRNLSLYYLNQMGIRPWVHKEKVVNIPDSEQPDTFKLIVLISVEPSSKAQSLLNRMMSYINVQQDALQIMTWDDFTNHKSLMKFETTQPRALLALGINAQKLEVTANSNYPVLQSLSLDELLDKPANKKQVFQDLHYLKTLL